MGERSTPSHQSRSSVEIPVNCRYCNDAGFLHPIHADGTPDFTMTVPCRHCAPDERVKRFLGISSMNATFDNFKQEPGTEDAYRAAKMIATLSTPWQMLFIYGGWGNGKTHLLEAISLHLWSQGLSVRVTMFPEFIAALKSTFDKNQDINENYYENIMKNLCEMPYLLLDDVGAAGSFTKWSVQQLERIILNRYRYNLFTVITTNIDYPSIPQFILSRFSDAEKGRIVINEGADYRPKNRGK